MIGFLTGILHDCSETTAVINVHGVGYEVFLPKSSLVRMGKKGDSITLEIYTHVNESTFQLFGFETTLEKKVFQQLISVSGIGPKMALNLLSNLTVSKLLTAITQGDVEALTLVSGVGSKTAQRIVVELKDKFKDEIFESHVAIGSGVLRGDIRIQDVASALVNLGYSETNAKRMIERISVTDDDTVQTLVKKTLSNTRSVDAG